MKKLFIQAITCFNNIPYKILQYIQSVLGISKLTYENIELRKQLRDVKIELEKRNHIARELSEGRKRLYEDIKHATDTYKLLTKDFSVAADINFRDPSVCLIMKKGERNMVKFYYFDRQSTLEDIYHYLERFDKERVKLDLPRGMYDIKDYSRGWFK